MSKLSRKLLAKELLESVYVRAFFADFFSFLEDTRTILVNLDDCRHTLLVVLAS